MTDSNSHQTPEPLADAYDVVILGGGLAGMSLARHLLRETDKTILLVERRDELPQKKQKVGESLVQLGGYYFSKVLDLEEHLLDEHYMKYNLRFYWPTPGQDPSRFEEHSQSYIRGFSNVASYQLDRNVLEGEMLRLNRQDPRFAIALGAKPLAVDLANDDAQTAPTNAPHRVSFTCEGVEHEIEAGWVVDTTGRGRFLAKRMDMARKNRIRHGAFFWWVDGRVNPETLTDLSHTEQRKHPYRRDAGHLPSWLATMHFMGDGFWFWVIPLRGKTSLGLVFDTEMIDPSDVFSVEKATNWVCDRLPLFARDLRDRKVLDFSGFRSYSHDCTITLSKNRWALAGESGRFSDPLYSPGSDLISMHNTMIVDAIKSRTAAEREAKCKRYEPLLRAIYEAYVPSYADGYPVLGDPEVFAMKYGWELTVYFAAYVFPFVNDLFTDRRFLAGFLRFFGQLGPLNRGLHELLAEYHGWKKENGRSWEEAVTGRRNASREPVYFDFMNLGPLAKAEKTFYEVGIGPGRAKQVLAEQFGSLRELAHFTLAHVASTVVGRPELVVDARFVGGLDPNDLSFDPARWTDLAASCQNDAEPWAWSFDARTLHRYVQDEESVGVPELVRELAS